MNTYDQRTMEQRNADYLNIIQNSKPFFKWKST